MGLLADGEAYLSDMFEANESVSIEYAIPPYGITDIVTLNATPGTPIAELEPGAYTMQLTNNRDFIVRRNDLIIGASKVIPDVGHRITETRDSVTYVYEVMDQPGDGPWRWSGAEYLDYRIHTTLVSRS